MAITTAPFLTGAGAFRAGDADAGLDEPDEASARTVVVQSGRAIRFDPYDRVYVLNEDLSLEDMDPEMQRAALLMLPRGGLRGSPDDGFPVDYMASSTPSNRQRAAEDAAAASLSVLVKAEQLEIVKVTLSSPWTGAFYTDVRSLVTGKTQTLVSTFSKRK